MPPFELDDSRLLHQLVENQTEILKGFTTQTSNLVLELKELKTTLSGMSKWMGKIEERTESLLASKKEYEDLHGRLIKVEAYQQSDKELNKERKEDQQEANRTNLTWIYYTMVGASVLMSAVALAHGFLK